MAVGFFFSPFILHRLGDVAYGVWVLVVAVVGYLSLLDMGLQGSILRFVSQGHAKQDHEFASDAVSAALWMRLQISVVAIVLSGCIAVVFPAMFKVPPAMVSSARIAIVLTGATTAATMTFGVYGGVISGLNRYDLQNYVALIQMACRVIGIVSVLLAGYGIASIAACELGATLIARCYQVIVARRLYPELKIRLRRPKRETLRKIWSYSIYAFLAMVAVQLIYQSDNLVVGGFISPTAVTFYAIASSLCRYATQVVSSMNGTFMPAASTYEASGDSGGLLMLYKNGTRATIAVSIPIILTFVIRGGSFISLWMGPRYGHDSGTVLIILSIPLLFSFANQTAGAIAFGTEKHQTLAMWSMGEGIANLVLSIILVHYWGIYGVAVGTLVPSLVTQLWFWPRYTRRLIAISPFAIVFKVWGPVIVASAPFAVAIYLLGRFVPVHTLAGFFAQILAALPVFVLSIGIAFRETITTMIIPKIRSMLAAQAA